MGRALLVQGLAYGDEGKGSVVDYLVRQEKAPLVVRFCGGAQAAHNVVTDDGRHHTFTQFGSGTFAGAQTFLSRGMLFNPCTLLIEGKALGTKGITDPLALVTVEKAAVVTTPFHMAANRIREMARTNRHGSCGMGIGETMDHSLKRPDDTCHVEDLLDPKVLFRKMHSIRDYLIEQVGQLYQEHTDNPAMRQEWDVLEDFETSMTYIEATFGEVARRCSIVGPEWLHAQLAGNSTIVFEGAQGVLLDQDYGWAPYNTWTDCTYGNALKLLGDTRVEVVRIGVLRGYMTRHGAGPLVTECPTCKPPPGEHNGDGLWQQNFRVGHFDPIAIRYALDVVGGVDQLAVTCLDHLRRDIKSCTQYTTSVGKSTWDLLPVQRLVGPEPYPNYQFHRQEEMTKIVSVMKPVYEIIPDVESFVPHIERVTKTPIKLLSFGPKASDKRPR